MENIQEDKEAGTAYLEDDSDDSNKKRYRYRRIYDDVGNKSFLGKTLAFFKKWFYLLASVFLVIAILLIGITLDWHIKVNQTQGERPDS